MASPWPRLKSRKASANAAVDVRAFAGSAVATAGAKSEEKASGGSDWRRAFSSLFRRRRGRPRPPPSPRRRESVSVRFLSLIVIAALSICIFLSSKSNDSPAPSSSSTLVTSPYAPPRDWTCPPSLVRVIDGDTISSAGITVRLLGIDAPEGGQTCGRRRRKGEESGWWRKDGERRSFPSSLFSSPPSARSSSGRYDCGEEATRALRSLVAGKNLRCERRGNDRYGRALASCSVERKRFLSRLSFGSKGDDGSVDVGEWMLRHGHAVFYSPSGGVKGATRETTARYVEAESAAKRERIGIWSGEFEAPSAWRERRRAERERKGRAKRKRRPSSSSLSEEREQEREGRAKKKRTEREQEARKKKRAKKKRTKTK